MYYREFTPETVSYLRPREVFVFGSNIHGMHTGGAARMAYERFGAEMGVGFGLRGQSFAIPTMNGSLRDIMPYVEQFIRFAYHHPYAKFYVTRIGCGAAGFSPYDIAPLFAQALNVPNIILPREFVGIIENRAYTHRHYR